MTGDFKERLSRLIDTYTEWVECDEWHIHDNTDEHEGAYPEHRDFDDAKFAQAIIDLMIELVEEDEPVIPAKELSEPLELAVERTKVGRNQLRAELINKLRGSDGRF